MKRALAEAQAAASPAAEQARTVVLACAEHQALKEAADQMQLYRQNNTLLRCASMPRPRVRRPRCADARAPAKPGAIL